MTPTAADVELRLTCFGCSTERRVRLHEEPLSAALASSFAAQATPPSAQAMSSAETMEILAADTTGAPVGGARAGLLDETGELSSLPVTAVPVTPSSPRSAEAAGLGEAQPVLPVGHVLGSFRLEGALGQGGMGVVYKAFDTSLDRHVALKVLAPALSRNAQFIERFRREAVACGKLSHPNITHIYSISGKDAPVHYFAMEYVEGDDLAEWVRRKGPFPMQQVLEIARQTALGLREAASARIIHRDVKPSNLLLTAAGQVKITDFGLAKARAAIGNTLDLTTTGVVMGTPLFMSPEQGRGRPVDHRSDIYSLGATLFYLACGCPPFDADTAIALILKHINDPVVFPPEPALEPGFRALLLRMLEKDATRRIGDYDQLLKSIERARLGENLSEEGDPRRLIVLNKRPRVSGVGTSRMKRIGGDGLKATKLSVARTNIKLGRRDKAMSLLQETIDDGDPALRAEAALLLLGLYEKEGDEAGLRRMAELVTRDSTDPSATAFASWKLAVLEERAAQENVRAALERYRAILADPPEGMPREVLEAQVARLERQLAEAERDMGSTEVVLGETR